MSLSRVRDLCLEAQRHYDGGELRAGLMVAEKAVADCTETLGRSHYAYPLSLCALGWLRHAVGEGAAALFCEAVARARALAEDDFEHALVVLTHAADFAKETGQTKRLEELTAELLALHRIYLGELHPRTLQLQLDPRSHF